MCYTGGLNMKVCHQHSMRRRGASAAMVACLLISISAIAESENPTKPKKKPTAEMEEYCKQTVKDSCGLLPATHDYVFMPEAADNIDAGMICSESCQHAIESVNCKGTEYEDMDGQYGPDGYECHALKCFNAIQQPCDITSERTSTWDSPPASCTSLCVTSLSSKECDKASDLPEAVHEECAWDYCKREIEESCGALDFLGIFGIDLSDDVHPWLYARSQQLCSPLCTSTWHSLMDTSHRAQCWKFDNLQDARLYLDGIVCQCYNPVLQGCGNVLELDRASMEAVTLRNPQCCQALNHIPCRLNSANTGAYDDYRYYDDYYEYDNYVWDGDSEESSEESSSAADEGHASTPAPAAANSEGSTVVNASQLKANSASLLRGLEFDIGDQVATRIAMVHKKCFPTDSFGGKSSSAPHARTPAAVAMALVAAVFVVFAAAQL